MNFLLLLLLLFDNLIHEIKKAAAILLGFDSRDAVDVRPVLDRLGRFGRLFLDAVVCQNVDQGQEIDFTSSAICTNKQMN